MTSLGIETANFQLVAQYHNQLCYTACPKGVSKLNLKLLAVVYSKETEEDMSDWHDKAKSSAPKTNKNMSFTQ
jgi:hypothetical protein